MDDVWCIMEDGSRKLLRSRIHFMVI